MQLPYGVQLFLLILYLVGPDKGYLLDTFVSVAVIGLFEMLKIFYPPEGLCRAEPERGPIVFTLHFIGVGRGTGGFKF